MYTGMKQAGLIGAACCGIASAQGTITYYWDINDTGLNNAVVVPGETVNLKMYAYWEPTDGVVGFAGSIYDIVGLENWETGEISLYDNMVDALTDEGDLQPNNDILAIEAIQLPPFFNPQFWAGNTLFLYEIEWTPVGWYDRIVRVTDANHLNNSFYIDDFGTNIEFTQLPSEGATISVIIPVPGTLFGLGVGGCLFAGMRRRR